MDILQRIKTDVSIIFSRYSKRHGGHQTLQQGLQSEAETIAKPKPTSSHSSSRDFSRHTDLLVKGGIFQFFWTWNRFLLRRDSTLLKRYTGAKLWQSSLDGLGRFGACGGLESTIT